MSQDTTYVGLDVHKESIAVAMLLPGVEEPIEFMQGNGKNAAKRLGRKLERQAKGQIQACYEAGPCGYTLQRELRALGITCRVIAPSLIPAKPGERIKTDRRDARKLAKYLRYGELTEVAPPTPEEEGVRDLVRARSVTKTDQRRARDRIQKMLLRRGIYYTEGKTPWTQMHMNWLRRVKLDDPHLQEAFSSYLLGLEQTTARLAHLESIIEEASKKAPYAEPIAHLRCFRGIDTVTAMTVVAELHGFMRFEHPRALMSFLGLVPSEHSSGEKRRQGSITKAGNQHVRRVLVEASWHYRHRPGVGQALQKRRQGQPSWVIAIADKAQQRLCRRYMKLAMEGKHGNVAVVAVARELVGFLWEVLYRHAAVMSATPTEELAAS